MKTSFSHLNIKVIPHGIIIFWWRIKQSGTITFKFLHLNLVAMISESNKNINITSLYPIQNSIQFVDFPILIKNRLRSQFFLHYKLDLQKATTNEVHGVKFCYCTIKRVYDRQLCVERKLPIGYSVSNKNCSI